MMMVMLEKMMVMVLMEMEKMMARKLSGWNLMLGRNNLGLLCTNWLG